MNAHEGLSSRRLRKRSRSRAGFSLMELMVVVAITSILAVTAIPSFTSYIYRSRASEPIAFLGVIKLRQEALKAEGGAYLTCNGVVDPANIAFIPAAQSSASQVFVPDACFLALSAKPDGLVRFGYGWAAGTPTDAAGVASLTGTGPLEYALTAPVDHYVIAQATGDLDNDGKHCIIEATSFTRGVWIGSFSSGGTLAAEPQGYE